MDFRHFLTLAQFLVRQNDEASWRSAISRGYYAAFHVARDFLRDLGFVVPRAETAHAFLWLRLSNAENAGVVGAGRTLNDLRSARNHADYQGKPAVTHASAVTLVESAERTIVAVDRARHGSERRQITEAVKKYERNVLKEVTWRA